MSKYPDEIKKMFGITSEVEIKFENPVEVSYELDGDEPRDIKNVNCINLLEGPLGTSIEIYYNTENGEGSVATANKNFKQIIIKN